MTKKLLLSFLMFMPLLASAGPVEYHEPIYYTEVDGFYYSFDDSNNTATMTCKAIIAVRMNDVWRDEILTGNYSGSVEISSEVTYNGKKYKVTSIGWKAFYCCESLTSVTILDGVSSIDGTAFTGCSSLASITIPESLTNIELSCFKGTAWYNNQPDGLVYNNNTLLGWKGEMPTGDISIKEGTKIVAGNAFNNCTDLTSVTIPEGVTSIGISAFADCSSLTSITIPQSVTSIGIGIFRSCSSLNTIIVDKGNTKYDSRNNCNAIIEKESSTLVLGCKNSTIPEGVTSIGESAFSGCSGLTSINIPDGVISIGVGAFYGCSGLTSINIPDDVTSIGGAAFSGCSGLTSIAIPSNVERIERDAFYGCSGLTSINIPDDVTSIGVAAFSGCSGLTSITIPSNVASIERNAFYNCSSLSEVISLPITPPTLSDESFPYREKYDYGFRGFDRKIKLVVQETALDTYMKTYPWNKFETTEVIIGGATERLKCATPTISFKHVLQDDKLYGQLIFSCETDGVTYNYSTTSISGNPGSSTGSVNIASGIKVEVYASKTGYTNSDKATLTLPISIKGDVNNDGVVNVADHVELSNIIMDQK